MTSVPEQSLLAQRCRYVLHAVAPMWAGDLDPDEQRRRLRLLTQARRSLRPTYEAIYGLE